MNGVLSFRALTSGAAAIVQLLVIAMLVERALAFLFEYHWLQRVTEGTRGIKPLIVLLLSALVCFAYRFDVLARLFDVEGNRPATVLGIAMTSVILAGWTVAALAVLQGQLNWSKASRSALIRAKQVTATAVANEAQARDIAARALVAEAEARRLNAERELAQARAFSPCSGAP
jgi:hypothetical protein